MKRIAVLAPVLALTGCGNYLNVSFDGTSALSRDEGGNLTIHMYVREDNAVKELELAGGFYDGPDKSNNHPLGRLRPEDPVSGYVAVSLSDPAP